MTSSTRLNRKRGEEMSYNYSKLLGRIVEKVGTQGKFAERMNLSERTISLKLNGKIEWKQNEIANACQILDIQEREIATYFFALEVQ
jgi:hypothetical protein